MTLLRTVSVLGTTLGVLGASTAYLIRRRISRSWIDCRSTNGISLKDKVIVITGANVGLGLEVAKDLSRRDAKVVLACRNVESGKKAAREISAATDNEVDVFELDLSSLASVRQFCSFLQQKYPTVDTLVCNAGVWVPMDQHAKTKDGFEIHFGVNHLGHFELIQNIKVDRRVVLVSSSLAKSGQVDMSRQDFVYKGRVPNEEKKRSFAPTGYCDSKLMNAMVAHQLSQRGQEAVAVCPGFCRSSLGRHVSMAWYQKMLLVPIMRLVQRSSIQGAQNIIYCVIENSLQNGGFYKDGAIDEPLTEHVTSFGEKVPKQLWDLSESLIKEMVE